MDLTRFSDDDLAELSLELESTLAVVLKVDPIKATLAAERRMAAAAARAWKSAADSSLVSSIGSFLRGAFTTRRLNSFLAKLGAKLKDPLTQKQTQQLRSRLRGIYRTSKRVAGKNLGAAVSFSQVDQLAVSAINRHQVFWVGNFYSSHLSDRIRAVSRDVILKQGLPRSEAGPLLRRAVAQELGLRGKGRSQFAAIVPARYAGDPDRYFADVASTAAHQARTFSTLQEMTEAEFKRFVIENPNDKRTSQICQIMSGKTFDVDVGVKQMQRALRQRSPAGVKRASPWLSGEEAEDVIANRGRLSDSEALARAGVVLPPFHPRCRSVIVVA